MLQLSATLINRPILSLRTGSTVAQTLQPIINPSNLKIEGFYCNDRVDNSHPILLTQDIREIIPQGIIVNDHDVLTEPEELVRLRDILALKFELFGKLVITEDKQRLGRVNDFAADSQTLYIQKLYVAQPLLRSFGGGQLGIERNQIVEITNKRIVVHELLKLHKAASPLGAPAA